MMSSKESNYVGFFTDNFSSDVVAKVVSTIFLFILIVVFISWYITLRRPHATIKSKCELRFTQFNQLFSNEAKSAFSVLTLREPSGESCDCCFSISKFEYHNLIILSKWSLIEAAKETFQLRQCFTKCNHQFQRNWRGLMLSHAFQIGRTKLINLFDCSLRNLPIEIHVKGARRGFKYFLKNLNENTEVNLNKPQFRSLTLQILFETALFNSDCSSSRCNRQALVSKLDYLLHCLMMCHVTGELPPNEPALKELATVTKDLLEPILLYEIEQSAIAEDDWVGVPSSSSTLVSHLLATKTALEKEEQGRESIDFSFLTTNHLAHTLFEIFLVAEDSLSKSLHVLFAALAQRRDWRSRLASEIALHQKDCPFIPSSQCNKYDVQLVEDCFMFDSPCYAWMKALSLEAIRFTVAGWPFGALRQPIRDGQLNGCCQEFTAQDLVLLNEPAVFHDVHIWSNCPMTVKSTSKWRPFNPNYHIQSDESNNLLSGILVNSTCAGFLPRAFVYQTLMASLLSFNASSWQLRDSSEATAISEDEIGAFMQSPCLLPFDSSALQSIYIKTSKSKVE